MSDRDFAEQFRTIIDPYGLPRRNPTTGTGEAAGGRVSATVATGGHVTVLRIDPAMVNGDTGSAEIAAAVQLAVNAAVDDLEAQLQAGLEDLDGPLGGLDRAWQRIIAEPAGGGRDRIG